MRARRLLVVGLVAGLLLTLAEASPAAAGLPGFYCATYSGPYFCMSFDGVYVTAGADYPSPKTECFNFECRPTRVQLVYFTGEPALTGWTVLSQSAPAVNFLAGPVKAPPVATWKPGTYCVREYNRSTGQWWDNLCLSTATGYRVTGKYGTTTPGL